MSENKQKHPGGAKRKFDEDAKRKFLEHYSKTGLLTQSANSVNMTYRGVQKHVVADPEFAERVEEARLQYRDLLAEEIHRRGVKGFTKPIYQQGTLVGYEQVYSDRMLELQAKRHEPEYRDKQQVDVNHTGGVLVVNATPETSADWMAQWGPLMADSSPPEPESDGEKRTKRG